jgi:hypothetical protein
MRDIEDIRDTGYIGMGVLCTRRASISVRVTEEGSNQRAKRRITVGAEGINPGAKRTVRVRAKDSIRGQSAE